MQRAQNPKTILDRIMGIMINSALFASVEGLKKVFLAKTPAAVPKGYA